MRFKQINLLVVLTLLVLCCYSSRYDDTEMLAGQIAANMNEYMDLLMKDAGPWIINNGLDPLRLLDITKQIDNTPAFFSYQLCLHLTNGVLHNLRNISRSGNSVMYYGHTLMRIKTEISMKNLNFRYDYDASVMNLGRRGWINGAVANVDLHADFLVDLVDFYIYIEDFRITSINGLDVRIRGNILIDWFSNLILKMIMSLCQSTVVNYISTQVYETAKITIEGINSRMSIYDRREVAAKFFNDIEIKTMLVV